MDNVHYLAIDRSLNFSIPSNSDSNEELMIKKSRVPRDPTSHRIIEKRRRDRMNNCLADLSQQIPTSYLQQGQGRIEKTEIIEMAILYMKHLQKQIMELQKQCQNGRDCCRDKRLMGYHECQDDVMRYLVEEKCYSGSDPFCVELMQHLDEQRKRFIPLPNGGDEYATQSATDIGNHQPPGNNMHTERNETPQQPQPMDIRITPPDPIPPPNVYQDKTFRANNTHTDPSMADLEIAIASRVSESLAVNSVMSKLKVRRDKSEFQDSGYNTNCSIVQRDEQESIKVDESSNHAQCNYKQNSPYYKFKNDIKLRFSADKEEDVPEVDNKDPQMLSQQNVEVLSQGMWNGVNNYCVPDIKPHGTSTSTSSSGGDGNVDSAISSGSNNERLSPSNLSQSVPAFALHPVGTYYLPIVVPVSQVMPFIPKGSNLGLCHPVSIPVNFVGPVSGVPPQSASKQTKNTDRIPNKRYHRANKSSSW